MHDDPDPKKEIVSSKMFGRRVYLLEELRQAVAAYTTRAAEKLREQDSVCSELVVSVQTSQFADPADRYWNGARMILPTPTADTRDLIQAANQGLHGIYRAGIRIFEMHHTAVQAQPAGGPYSRYVRPPTAAKRRPPHGNHGLGE